MIQYAVPQLLVLFQLVQHPSKVALEVVPLEEQMAEHPLEEQMVLLLLLLLAEQTVLLLLLEMVEKVVHQLELL